MSNNIERDVDYINSLISFVREKYLLEPISIIPAKRGFYGETWKVETREKNYFLKLDYFIDHKLKFQNSLKPIDYLHSNGIDFINEIVKTKENNLFEIFNSGILVIFHWINGENVENQETKIYEYQLLSKVYAHTKFGFEIPTLDFSSKIAAKVYHKWEELKANKEINKELLELLDKHSEKLAHRAMRLKQFAELCQNDRSNFYFTHGDAGGNFMLDNNQYYIVDWDEIMYSPPERDAWVMCHKPEMIKIFNKALKQNNIKYKLQPERLAYYCYFMFFWYLNEVLVNSSSDKLSENVTNSLNGWVEERINYADTIK